MRLQCHHTPAGPPRPLGCCHGPETWRSSTRPVWQPGSRASASGHCFWRRCTTRKTSEIKGWFRASICHMVLFCSDGSDPVRPSRRPFWQPASPCLASWGRFWPCQTPAPTDAVAVSSHSGRPATAAGVLPWARGLAILYTTRMAAWIPNLCLRRQFLAALHHSQNQ